MNAISFSEKFFSNEHSGFFFSSISTCASEQITNPWRDSLNSVFNHAFPEADTNNAFEGSWTTAIDSVTVESLIEVLARQMRELNHLYEVDKTAVEQQEKSREALRISIEIVEKYITEDDFFGLNDLLSLVDPTRLRKITAVSFLRSTFRVRSRVYSWNTLYQRTKDSLVMAGYDPNHVLRGM